MYLVAGHFQFSENNCQRAVEIMNEIVRIGRAEKGIHQYRFYANPDSENAFFLFEEWSTKEDHDRHFESEAIQALVPEFFELLTEPPQVSYFDADLAGTL